MSNKVESERGMDGWNNFLAVEKDNDARAKSGFVAAQAAGQVKLEPLADFQRIALKAEMAKRGRYPGDRTVDLDDGTQLVQFKDKLYVKNGESFSAVKGYALPAMPMG